MTDPQNIDDVLAQMWAFASTKPSGQQVRAKSAREMVELFAGLLQPLLIAQAAHLKELEHENKELLARVELGATTPGTGSTASSPMLEVTAAKRPKRQAKRLRDRATMNILTVDEPYPGVTKKIVRQLLSALEAAERTE